MTDEPTWRARALCAGGINLYLPGLHAFIPIPLDLFFPDRGAPTAPAKRICQMCPVRADCLEHALTKPEMFGVWGGTSELDRRPMLQARGLRNYPAPRKYVDHARIVELYQQGLPMIDVAAGADCSIDAAYKHIRAARQAGEVA